MINILIRNGYRPQLFRRCLNSIQVQTYKDIRVIIANDSEDSIKDCYDVMNEYSFDIECMELAPNTEYPFYWNMYCNDLKDRVPDGWFFYLDNDDYLIDKFALEILAKHLTDPGNAIICQFMRNGRPKPTGIHWGKIVCGKIGGSCIILHHTQKNVADWDGRKAADFRFISAVAKKLPIEWVKHVVVKAGNGGLHGKI